MPSELEQAFEDTLDAAEQVKGYRETVGLQSNLIDALVWEDSQDINPTGGGLANGGTINVAVRLGDVTLPLATLEPIVVRGYSVAVLRYTETEARVDLVCGDESAQINGY